MPPLTADTTETVIGRTVAGTASYSYLPFDVPPGVTRLDLSMTANRWAHLGIGLFDPRGAGHASPGFRGLTGAERREIFLGLREATPGFTAGPIPAGRWTVLVPVFFAPLPTRLEVRVRMTFGDAVSPAVPDAVPGVVRDAPGWYRGDLHCHTTASSDAWGSGSALTPAGWADVARDLGLDFLAMTDHNVVSQNSHLARDAAQGVLLLAGEEVTNYFHGHATVSGIAADDWFDFRHSPFGFPLPTGGARIDDLVAAVRAAGGYLSAAHPAVPWGSWHFLAEAVANPAARPDGLEVWNGRWQSHDEVALRIWHRLLRAGWAVVANGGSDLHGTANEKGLWPGTPTTVVHAPSLARQPLVAALRAGRSFVTRRPHGVQIFLTASGPGGQHTFTGGRIHACAGEVVTARVRVQHAGGMRLTVLTARGRALSTAVDGDDVTVEVPLPMGTRPDFVRAEVRRPATGPIPIPRRLLPGGMEAFTNPIRLVVGRPPPGVVPEHAPPPE